MALNPKDAFRQDALAAHAASASVLGEVYWFGSKQFSAVSGIPADAHRVADTEIGIEHDRVIVARQSDLPVLPVRNQTLDDEAHENFLAIVNVKVKAPFVILFVKDPVPKN